VAQYGRVAGMIQSFATEIIFQFTKNLETQIDQFKVGILSSLPIASTSNVGDVPALQVGSNRSTSNAAKYFYVCISGN